jgi:CubicO group peptidase (beta-lactamase class C family)
VLGDDLPLIDDAVTVEHLPAHRSGIGDYFDEEVITDVSAYVLPVPAQFLRDTEQYLAALAGFPQKFPPGTRFSYCNAGFVVLALIAERVSDVPFHDLVDKRVRKPAGHEDTDFLRSDSLGERTAIGYLPIDGSCAPTCSTCRSAVAETAGSTPRRLTSARCGGRSSPVGSCRRTGWPRWCGRAAT